MLGKPMKIVFIVTLVLLTAGAASADQSNDGATARAKSNGDLGSLITDGLDVEAALDPPCYDDANRYVVCGNGTVTDTVTGLTWLKNANCFGFLTYSEANAAAVALKSGECGLTDNSSAGDWRLPTQEEWETTIARAIALECEDPILTDAAGTGCYADAAVEDQQFFGVQGNGYWSATTYENLPNYAWGIILFGNLAGFIDKGGDGYVWPVRAGK